MLYIIRKEALNIGLALLKYSHVTGLDLNKLNPTGKATTRHLKY